MSDNEQPEEEPTPAEPEEEPKAKKKKKAAPFEGDLEQFLTGGNPTAEARAAGITDDDVSGGSFVDEAAVREKLAGH